MKKRKYFVYKFEELTEEQKKLALKNYSDINVDHDWWDSTYEDAENIGLKLSGFDIYQNNLEINFTLGPEEVAEKIIENHGEDCETYKSAKVYLVFRDADCFLNNLKKDYLKILENEYYYLISDEAIKETFTANDYWFTEKGKID